MPQTAERTERKWRVSNRVATTSPTISVWYSAHRIDRDRAFAERKKAAVLNYVRSLRTLGKVRVNSGDVADALDLPEREVRRILLSLGQEGVRAP